ncbi:MAG: 5-(carboxyamino)imidazole ribonucleotide mutase [Elusimicrobiota bacterium]|jgi:5-(carboxyamino)imidazole ribonucleotide mutase|nr:5-(carboxyamino)imidazole ribonucleotide mutase [Elusimicrobiota bacterium]
MTKNLIDIAIIVGSDSDLEIINETVKTLTEFEITYKINIASAHRTTHHLKECIESAQKSGAKVFIAGAGMSAALPGAIAAETVLPVIGVPIMGTSLSSLDSLFSIVQMPRGAPVACVAVGKSGAVNAALLAIEIIAITNTHLRDKLIKYKKSAADKVIEKDSNLQKVGIETFIKERNK